MITLDHPNKKLQVLLSGAVNTNELPINVGFKEISAIGASQRAADAITTGGTAVDVLQGSAGLRRLIQAISIYNADLAAVTVTIRLYNATGTTRVITTLTLQTLETLCYDEERGFYCLDVNGNQKSNSPASSGASSTALSAAESAATRASTALSAATSLDTASDTAFSAADSTVLSAATSINTARSTQESVVLSSATSFALRDSTATSAVQSNDTRQSTDQSSMRSLLASGGQAGF